MISIDEGTTKLMANRVQCEFCKVISDKLKAERWLEIKIANETKDPPTYFCSLECLYLDLHTNWRPHIVLTQDYVLTSDSIN